MDFVKKVSCPTCRLRFIPKKKSEWSDQLKCPACGRVFNPEFSSIAVTGVKTKVTGFGYDKSGKMVGIDTKGKHVDPKETYYDIQKDPHGWKATGKKVREKDKYGNPNF